MDESKAVPLSQALAGEVPVESETRDWSDRFLDAIGTVGLYVLGVVIAVVTAALGVVAILRAAAVIR